jgi:anti-sigma B factor antagonist
MAWELADDRKRYDVAKAMLAVAEFRVDVARERDAVRVSPVGELDVASIGSLRAQMDAALASGARCVILDLRDTTFLDSSALHLAVEADERAAEAGIEFAIIPGPDTVQRTFDIAGLTALLPFVDVPRG